MQTKRYKVLSIAYPRYHYSVKNGVSISKRFNVILKDIGFDNESSRFNLPEIEEPQIIIACGKEKTQTVDVADIELNRVNSIQQIEKINYKDFESLIDDNKVNDLCPKIVVVELKEDTSSKVRDYEKWKHNVIIVVNDEDSISQRTDAVRITKKENLGLEICLMLERIAFRNMLPLIPVLRGLLATADFQPLTEVVLKEISDVMRSFLKKDTSLVGWMHDIDYRRKFTGTTAGEIIPRNFEKYLLKDAYYKDRFAFRDDVNTEYIVKYEEGRRGKRKVKEETDNTDDDVPIQRMSTDEKETAKSVDGNNIETSTSHTTDKYKEKANTKRGDCKLKTVDYFEENETMYELVGKLAEHIDHTLEQEVITEFRKLPKEFKSLLNFDIENQNIRAKVADELFKLFVCTIDSKLDDDDPAEEMVLVKLRYRTGVILCGLRTIVAQLKLVESTDHHIKLIKIESDRAINRLLGDLIGLFKRSKIPTCERPKSGEMKRLNDKVAKKLLEDIAEAKCCGYRYDKLHIFVEEISDQDKKETVESDIKKILLGYNISDYIVSSTTRSVQHFKQVGAKIRVTRSGTLGGFALMGEQEHLCALLSKHVVNGAIEVRYKGNSESEMVIASMIQAGVGQVQHVDQASSNDEIMVGGMIQADVHQEQHGSQANAGVVPFADRVEDNAVNENKIVDYVDVAAAKILDSVRPDCDTHFKDSQRQPMKSKLCGFTDAEISELSGLQVHICGASTELGTGTISMPELYVEGMQKLVVIEDVEDVDGMIVRFSRQGDSGAVICADHPDGDYVQVISMLVGCRNYEKISESNPFYNKNKGEYMSFRMINGLECLEKETKQVFKLCNAC